MKKVLLIFLLFGTIVFGKTLVGKVIKVYDGDTIIILVNGKKEKIRFYGIDAPEIKQSYGIESRDFVRNKIMDKEVKVKIMDIDKYGRKIGKIYYKNERYLNLESVKSGNSWWYKYYAKNQYDLKLAQEEAKKHKIGLWSQKNPINPYEYRKKIRKEK